MSDGNQQKFQTVAPAEDCGFEGVSVITAREIRRRKCNTLFSRSLKKVLMVKITSLNPRFAAEVDDFDQSAQRLMKRRQVLIRTS